MLQLGMDDMKLNGFKLVLNDLCEYCPYFEPKLEKINITTFGNDIKYLNVIRCMNERACHRVAENLNIRSRKQEKQG